MKKRTMAVLALLSVCFLAGCGGSGGSESGGTTGGGTTGGSTTGGSTTGGGAGSRKAAGHHPVTIVMIPKFMGVPYFNACQKGAEEAAKSLPGVNLVFTGPPQGPSMVEQQIDLIQTWIVRKPDVIAVSCNNPDELAPVLKRARDKGIHVITWDADASPRSGREFFVNQATAEGIGNTLVDVMAKEAGPAAPTGVITSTLTAPNQSEWLKYMRQRIAQKYPKMQILFVYPCEEDQSKAFSQTQNGLKGFPQVKGIWGISSTAFPGAAEAVKQAQDTGKVAVTGLATPQPMKPYVDAGVVKTVILWNPIDLGYLTVYVGDALANDTLQPGSHEVSAGRLGKKTITGDQVILGPPMLFTKSNVGQFAF